MLTHVALKNERHAMLARSAHTRSVVAIFAATILCLVGNLSAQEEKKVDLQVGDSAPLFQSKDDQGLTWKSSDYLGKKYVVVYFYPGDFTPGCTVQAQKFRDSLSKLYDQGAEVVGVSGDSTKTHALFKENYKLTFTLVADEKGELARKFGVPLSPGAEVKTRDAKKQPLSFKREITTARWTFIIGLDGKILYKNTKVEPVKDSQLVAAILEKLEKK